ncbi:tRNA (adenosine(37)-N6)-threonylcarbamoyltransferase complex ATPase subunit type 1 TsaE [Zhaonella formicivorans]|uniref:tRNA (adenosine(37)-N6)-threonylcarbamoyltransferase complex ATPase subunit type 1 TsaE n=1 Tax=Zhaonella formicivorans TaxID=2528593 RepID=UPI0010E5F64C|nr:tRNA (adenosine(37)-N6)-threonylcarbamoyltransferase complex ATPase subunit type 1 TsaE [Zhaonella formicivorans]
MFEYLSTSSEETKQLGYLLSRLLQPRDVIRLEGDLGAGKTTFAQGVCTGLGVASEVTSPTFTILHIYDGKMPVYHIDAYRIESELELEDLGLEEYLEGQGVSLVEWAEKILTIMPDDYLQVEIRRGLGESERKIIFTAVGAGRYQELIEELEISAGTRA